MIDTKADELKANLEERIRTAMERYYRTSAGRKANREFPLRRKRNRLRGGQGIVCGNDVSV